MWSWCATTIKRFNNCSGGQLRVVNFDFSLGDVYTARLNRINCGTSIKDFTIKDRNRFDGGAVVNAGAVR